MIEFTWWDSGRADLLTKQLTKDTQRQTSKEDELSFFHCVGSPPCCYAALVVISYFSKRVFATKVDDRRNYWFSHLAYLHRTEKDRKIFRIMSKSNHSQ
jgi:hypothetical protein